MKYRQIYNIKCSWCSADRRCPNYIWVIKNFIANWCASSIIGITVVYSIAPWRTCPENFMQIRPTFFFVMLLPNRIQKIQKRTPVSKGFHATSRQYSRFGPCVIYDLSCKLHKNPFSRFSVKLLTDTDTPGKLRWVKSWKKHMCLKKFCGRFVIKLAILCIWYPTLCHQNSHWNINNTAACGQLSQTEQIDIYIYLKCISFVPRQGSSHLNYDYYFRTLLTTVLWKGPVV